MLRQLHINSRQRGVSAIEFAIVFPIIMLVFYAMVSYAVIFLYTLSLNALAAEVARSGVQIYTTQIEEDEIDGRSDLFSGHVDQVIAASWLEAGVSGCADGGGYFSDSNDILDICLAVDRPMAPLSIFGVTVPDVPERLSGRAAIRLAP